MVKLGRPATAPASCRRLVWLAVAATLVAMTAGPRSAPASETDQFLVWGVELADGSEQLNLFVNQEFERALERLGGGGQRPCHQVPGRLYRRAFSSLFSSRLRRFIERSDIEWYPRRDVSYWDYRAQSVFRRSVFSFFIPMARTVRIGDVYLGVDKLAHMFGIGRRYHVRYQRLRRNGRMPEEAQRETIVWGFNMELYFLGGYAEGIVSHADLEANFQGLRLARDMCEGEDPFLVRDGAGWRFARPIDLRDYVNPGFDESYNSNHYFDFQWRVVQPILVEEYCPRYASEEVQRRLARYREIDAGSLSRKVLADYYRQQGRKSPERFALDHLCTEGQQSAQAGAESPRSGADAEVPSSRQPTANGGSGSPRRGAEGR